MKRAILFLIILIGLSYVALGAINDGINACYSLDTADGNATYYYDSVGTNDVKYVISPTPLDSSVCKIGQCVGFNFSVNPDDALKSADNLNISGAVARTINFWAYSRAKGGQNHVVFFHGVNTDGNRFSVMFMNEYSVYFSGGAPTSYFDTGNDFSINNWQMYTVTYDGAKVRVWIDGVLTSAGAVAKSLSTTASQLEMSHVTAEEGYEGHIDEFMIWGRNLTGAEILDLYTNTRACSYVVGTTTAPVLSNINCTSCGAQGDTIAPYSTSDTTPSFAFDTNVQSNCRVGDENQDYPTMGVSRNCTSGDGTTSHTCTLTAQDTLTTATDYVYLACSNTLNANSSTTELEIDLSLLSDGDEIDDGIQTSLIWPGAAVYTNQKVYLRDLNNNQLLVTVDRVAVYGNQRWIINHDASTALGLFNITPVVYTLDMVNLNLAEIESKVSAFINATKS